MCGSPEKLRGKLVSVVEQIDHGHHVFRANFKSAVLRQYEKFSRFLRNELLSNNLNDFDPRKGLDHLDEVRQRFQTITDRFAAFQAQCLNAHVDFPLLQKIAPPLTIGSVRYPGIKIHDTRIVRLLEVPLHGGNTVGGWTAQQIHAPVVATFQLSPGTYGLNQLRYDLRKLKGHALPRRDGRRYACRLTAKGVDVALLFLFFHKRLCGPSPTAASTTSLTPSTGQIASWMLRITKPTRPLRRSLTCDKQPDTIAIAGLVLFRNED